MLLLSFFKQAYHANPGADMQRVGTSSYISINLILKTSASSNVSLGHISYDTCLDF